MWFTETMFVLMANEGCKEKCGNVIIPYPFGIGYSSKTQNNSTRIPCFANHWFEIECKNSTPFLTINNNTPTRVYDISLDPQIVEVEFPVMSRNCGNDRSQTDIVMDFRNTTFYLFGSPRYVGKEENTLMAFGCNNVVRITDMTNSTNFSGCVSICEEHDLRFNNECNAISGVNCCKATIPEGLRAFNLSLGIMDPTLNTSTCSYATLGHPQYADPFHMINSTGYGTLLLNWAYIKTRQSDTVSCESYHGTTSFQCWCNSGYKGNPYTDTGCIDNNHCAYSSHGCGDNGRNLIRVIIGVSIGVGIPLLLLCAWGLHKVINKIQQLRLKKKYFKHNGGLLLQQHLCSNDGRIETIKLFNSKEIEKATDHYNENLVVGQGAQGTVYKGMLSDGRIVAIKKLKRMDEGEAKQFIDEVIILSQINHRNVVKLLGCCLEAEIPFLIYEFISNGTLYHTIHSQNEEFQISLEMRLQIAADVAGALFHLHNAASLPIYHRDIKSTNILLDDKYRAKVSDFGTSRSVAIDKTHLTTLVKGTFGYLDPEYFRSSQFTDKSDVYSFGVVVAELLTGELPVSLTKFEEGVNLALYFTQSMKENRLFEILDHQIKETNKAEIVAVAQLVERCLNSNGKERPTMKEVVVELEVIRISKGTATTLVDQQQNSEEFEYKARDMAEEEAEGWDTSTSAGSWLNDDAAIVALKDSHHPLSDEITMHIV